MGALFVTYVFIFALGFLPVIRFQHFWAFLFFDQYHLSGQQILLDPRIMALDGIVSVARLPYLQSTNYADLSLSRLGAIVVTPRCVRVEVALAPVPASAARIVTRIVCSMFCMVEIPFPVLSTILLYAWYLFDATRGEVLLKAYSGYVVACGRVRGRRTDDPTGDCRLYFRGLPPWGSWLRHYLYSGACECPLTTSFCSVLPLPFLWPTQGCGRCGGHFHQPCGWIGDFFAGGVGGVVSLCDGDRGLYSVGDDPCSAEICLYPRDALLLSFDSRLPASRLSLGYGGSPAMAMGREYGAPVEGNVSLCSDCFASCQLPCRRVRFGPGVDIWGPFNSDGEAMVVGGDCERVGSDDGWGGVDQRVSVPTVDGVELIPAPCYCVECSYRTEHQF